MPLVVNDELYCSGCHAKFESFDALFICQPCGFAYMCWDCSALPCPSCKSINRDRNTLKAANC